MKSAYTSVQIIMPEKAASDSTEKNTNVRNEREITQTDKLNKRLLTSCLQFVNSERNSVFNQAKSDNQENYTQENQSNNFKD